MTTATEYLVSFERVGRRHDVAPLKVSASDVFDLAEKIYRYVRPMLASREIEVVTPDEGKGSILAGGFRNAGGFTVTKGGGPND
ncbi:hypothetical protein [uncultured Aeromicrobium sp.]|uniref:hypothetical protein n=1 Tax=uncultured Aeromicrobium sp. TaxID=337820 RepID=UPI0025E9890F|nr:hypothetical protein [uncultured Aeromicrobium sp.]